MSNFYGAVKGDSIISVVGKTTVEIIELFECIQKLVLYWNKVND